MLQDDVALEFLVPSYVLTLFLLTCVIDPYAHVLDGFSLLYSHVSNLVAMLTWIKIKQKLPNFLTIHVFRVRNICFAPAKKCFEAFN